MVHPLRTLLTIASLAVLLAGCAGTPSNAEVHRSPSAEPCPQWGCAQQARFATASAMIAGENGHVGIVVKDRVTGEVWRAGEPDLPIWAGSTPKLAFIASLKEDEAAGRLTLDDVDDQEIDAILSVSDNLAAEDLWDRYGQSASLMQRWQGTYGMTQASYVDGWPERWGFVKCTSEDLVNLMTYILEKADPSLRTFVVERMRTVGPPQQWGVWGAGPDLRPGVKDGWSIEEDENGVDHWVTATVGFAGPDERYVLAAMYDQAPGDTIDAGVHVLTDLVATVFGAPVPAPAEVPDGY